MSSLITWNKNGDWGELAVVGEYKLFVIQQAVVDLSIRVTWVVMLNEDNVMAEGEERVTHKLAMISGSPPDPMKLAKSKAEHALFDIVGTQEIEKWLTEE